MAKLLALKKQQQGLGLGKLIAGLIIVSLFAILVMKTLPSLIEYRAIQGAVTRAKSAGSTVAEIRRDFDRAAQIDNIESISGKDLEITKEGEEVVITFAYSKKIPLIPPVSLLIDYSGGTRAR